MEQNLHVGLLVCSTDQDSSERLNKHNIQFIFSKKIEASIENTTPDETKTSRM